MNKLFYMLCGFIAVVSSAPNLQAAAEPAEGRGRLIPIAYNSARKEWSVLVRKLPTGDQWTDFELSAGLSNSVDTSDDLLRFPQKLAEFKAGAVKEFSEMTRNKYSTDLTAYDLLAKFTFFRITDPWWRMFICVPFISGSFLIDAGALDRGYNFAWLTWDLIKNATAESRVGYYEKYTIEPNLLQFLQAFIPLLNTIGPKGNLIKLIEQKAEGLKLGLSVTMTPKQLASVMTVWEECPVCLERKYLEPWNFNSECRHYLCTECKKDWMAKNPGMATCPICGRKARD